MVPQPTADLLWAVCIPGGELRCLTWQVTGQWCVGIFDNYEMFVHATAPDADAARRWADLARREIDRLGLGDRPTFDPAIDVAFEPYDAFDDLVDVCGCTDARGPRH